MYRCPKCNISLEEYFYQDVPLYKCPKCKGFWFQESRFGQTKDIGFEGLQDPDTLPQQETKNLETVEFLSCPECHTDLAGYIYAYSSGIQLYRCITCKGIWAGQAQLSAISQVLRDYKESLEEAKLKALPLILKVKEDMEKEEKQQPNRPRGFKFFNKLLSKLGF